MVYLPRKMDEAHVALQFRSEMEEMRREIDQRLTALETPPPATLATSASPNYIPNSHPEWSHLAYTVANTDSGDATDPNLRAYNWFFQKATETTLSDADTLSAPYDQGPLLAEGHSNFNGAGSDEIGADAPVWDKVNGRFQLGWETINYDIACPLPTDFVFPGQRYYIYFETILDADTVNLQDAEFYCGFWDNTPGQEKWIEGSDFTPIYDVFGVPGTRTLKYKIKATTDGGDQILSTEITVPNAPNVLSSDSHVRLFFTGAAGFIRFEIYRKDGTVYRRVGDIRNSVDLQFFDMQENAGTVETGYPSITAARPQAKGVTVGLTGNATGYTVHTMLIRVPTSYNRSNTGNASQWFRFGLNGPISDARGLGIRRIMVSEGFGPWTRSSSDLRALSGPSSSAANSPEVGIIVVDTTSTTNGGVENGPILCVTLDTVVEVMYQCGRSDIEDAIPISELQVGMNVVCGAQALPVTAIKDGVVQEIYEIATEGGLTLRCSSSHRIIRSYFDKFGTAARYLRVGDTILTAQKNAIKPDVICNISVHHGSTPVRSITIPKPHLYITNGIISHNEKGSPNGPLIVVGGV